MVSKQKKPKKTYEELFQEHAKRLRRRKVITIALISAIIVVLVVVLWYMGYVYEPATIYVDTEGNLVERSVAEGREGILP